MHRRLIFALPLVPALARAETPAERASRQLQQGVRQDRVVEAGGPEGPRPAETTPVTRAMEVDRRSIQPDVGRPEENGAPLTAGESGTLGGRNPQR
ncbi:hypothetical protein [Roseicella aquatilis]|uniref:Uncharacterized protein n=1 Tax=Roseicella aquatilis TaxID=2527868 RepID=A0A4R4DX77_9PROT|nr:hypothetical protein [Roseicella aquatilis]TCZ65493.1 hypothetical protein EXY23_04800 [Roseicella aquatilis]